MGLWVPPGASEFGWTVSNIQSTRPAQSLGATITPGQNTKGAYTSIITGAGLTRDVFGLWINFNSNFVGGAARDTLVDIGVDPAGGSAYSVLIPDLLASCAGAFVFRGINYYFPIWVRAGSSLGARASVNNASVGTLRCWLQAWGSPRDPRMVRVGTRVTAYSVVPTTSSGIPVVPGTTSEGTWTRIGVAAGPAWWWQIGVGVNDSTMGSGAMYFADMSVGDASNKRIVIQDQLFVSPSANEQFVTPGAVVNCGYDVGIVDVYGRMQCSATPDSNMSMVAYGLTG